MHRVLQFPFSLKSFLHVLHCPAIFPNLYRIWVGLWKICKMQAVMKETESMREMLYRQACGEHKHSSESSNHPMVCVLPNYLQCLPIGSSTRVVKPDQYICNRSALKIKIKLRFHWLYILARGKNVVFLYIPFLLVFHFRLLIEWPICAVFFGGFCGLNCFNMH